MPDQTLPQEKTCSKCGETKPLDQFYRDSRVKSGRRSDCKDCRDIQDRAWKLANQERVKANRRRWREENPERDAELNKRWAEQNPERKAENHKKWSKANPERQAELHKRHNKRHPAKYRARRAISNAVQEGRIVKPDRCEDCDKLTEARDLHGHHMDYSRPLDVDWLCRDCHRDRHAPTPL